jgi:hypothetical protein
MTGKVVAMRQIVPIGISFGATGDTVLSRTTGSHAALIGLLPSSLLR